MNSFLFVLVAVACVAPGSATLSIPWDDCETVNEKNKVSENTFSVSQCQVNVTLTSSGAATVCPISVLDTDSVLSSVVLANSHYTCDDGETETYLLAGTDDDMYEQCLQLCIDETAFECRSAVIKTLVQDVKYQCITQNCFVGESYANITLVSREPRAELDEANTDELVRSLWITDPTLCYGNFATMPPTPNYVQVGYLSGFDLPIEGVWLGRENVISYSNTMDLVTCAETCRTGFGVGQCKAFTYEVYVGEAPYCYFFDAYAAHYQKEHSNSVLYLPRLVFADPTEVASSDKIYMDQMSLPSDVIVIKTETIGTFINTETVAVGQRTFFMFFSLFCACIVGMVFNCTNIRDLF